MEFKKHFLANILLPAFIGLFEILKVHINNMITIEHFKSHEIFSFGR